MENDRIALNLNAKRVIELCIDEARRLGNQQVHPEHLLSGLVREQSGIVPKILKDHGVDTERIHIEFIRIQNRGI